MTGGPSGDVIQKIELLNYASGARELVDIRAAINADEPITITPAGDPSRFVQPITREVTVEITWLSEEFSGPSFSWCIDIDQAVWLIEDSP